MKTSVIHTGDCIRWLPTLPRPSVDLVFVDPPFNIGWKYGVYHDKKSDFDYSMWCQEWIGLSCKTLKPGGAMWVAINDERVSDMFGYLKRFGLEFRNWCIWSYTFGPHLESKFGRNKAHLLYFTKGKPAYFKPERIESERQRIGDKRANPAGRVPGDVWTEYPRIPGNSKERTGHPCQMPVGVLERIITACTRPGDLVIDPMAGSGTTLVAAEKLGRRWAGCEIDPVYCDIIRTRIASVTPTLQEQQ